MNKQINVIVESKHFRIHGSSKWIEIDTKVFGEWKQWSTNGTNVPEIYKTEFQLLWNEAKKKLNETI